METHHDVVVVGAGQAGLATAYHLKEAGADFVVLEQGVIGDTWITHRWDSFALNTPNHTVHLPGAPYSGDDAAGFMTHLDLVDFLHAYVERFDLPVREGVAVTALRSGNDHRRFELDIADSGGSRTITADAVVVASGSQREPNIPAVSRDIPDGTLQIPAASYRNAQSLPDGGVLVVGGAQSGGQIVEDLLHAGRAVFWSISNAPRAPRRYRGRDIVDWMIDVGVLELAVEDAKPEEITMTNVLTSGVGTLGHTLSFQWLGTMGAHLVGRIAGVEGGCIVTDGRVADYIAHGDETSAEITGNIDKYIEAAGLDAPPNDEDPADEPAIGLDGLTVSDTVDLDDIAAVIWATGYRPKFDWIDLPVFDDHAHPIHTRGVANIDGLFFMGFPWLTKRKSGIIYGVAEDAEHIATATLSSIAEIPEGAR